MTVNPRTSQIATAAALAGATAASMFFWQSALRTGVQPLSLPHVLPSFKRDHVKTPLFAKSAAGPPKVAGATRPSVTDRPIASATGRALVPVGRRTRGGSTATPTGPSHPQAPAVGQPQPPATGSAPATPAPVTATPTPAATPVTPVSKKATRAAEKAARKLAHAQLVEAKHQQTSTGRTLAVGRQAARTTTAQPLAAEHSSKAASHPAKGQKPPHPDGHGQGLPQPTASEPAERGAGPEKTHPAGRSGDHPHPAKAGAPDASQQSGPQPAGPPPPADPSDQQPAQSQAADPAPPKDHPEPPGHAKH